MLVNSPGLYLYHNLPILQIHTNISYHIDRTDTDTDIHSLLYQLVYACASCPSRGARGKFKMAKLEALSRRGSAVLRVCLGVMQIVTMVQNTCWSILIFATRVKRNKEIKIRAFLPSCGQTTVLS